MADRRALIIGIGGQDGSYLAEFLLAKGYEVTGLQRHSPADIPRRLLHVRDRIRFVRGDLIDQLSLMGAIRDARPHEIYNFAGTSFVPESWQQPALTVEYTGMGVVRLLEAIRILDPSIRFYQAATSEIFGRPATMPQNESTALDPSNPYAVSKLLGHLMVGRYREGYDLFAVSGILYNHESPRRGREFVTRKITHAAASIALGLESALSLGDLSAQRDWGFAGDYVRGMWLMLQHDRPFDYVVATGVLHTVRDICEVAFGRVGLDWREYVRVDESLLRPRDDRAQLVGDASRARAELGWEPELDFTGLIELMVDADLAQLEDRGRYTAAMDWPAALSPYAP